MQNHKPNISHKTLIPVLRAGFFISVTGGLIAGTLHIVFAYAFNVTITWFFLIILAHMIAKKIKKSYERYHIAYSFISIFFFLFAFYIMHVTLLVGVLFIRNFLSTDILGFIINPINYFKFLWPFQQGFFEVSNLLDVVFFSIGVLYSYRYSK